MSNIPSARAPLADVETDKVNMEVEATSDGTVFHLMYDVGDDVPVTEVIAFLLAPGEAEPTDWTPPPQVHLNKSDSAPAPAAPPPADPAPSAPAPTNGSGDVAASPVARRIADEHNVDLSGVSGSGPKGRITRKDVEAAMVSPAPVNGGPVKLAHGKVPATPAARRIAGELGVDITTITGSGPDGRIQGDDVRAAAARPSPAPQQATLKPPTPEQIRKADPTYPFAASEPEVIPLKGMRKRIAERMQASFRDAPHIFFDATVDMRGILALRQRIKAQDEKLSVTSVIVKACAWTLMQHPMMNATFDGQSITVWDAAHVGVAVALDNGLIVPVVHNADKLPLRQIQQQITDVAGRARDGKLMPDDMQGGTFTVSNLGMFGVDRFTAIVNPPQVAIVAVGRTVEQFVPDENGNPVLVPQMSITVSADHRVVDGAQVGQFIGDLHRVLEDPMLLVW
ncbi:MAG: 2-oxo acid dehydrogenase subunit E2 [Chloroflexota bacterium]